ncbi:hypothetical protein [Clostridium perfringens]|uniref:hypothetical protein n=1 Tax=Clostridium perfringens TaxID=1502 RepID=UPI001A343B8C|nr:hypothetical protein [Clostridium perfringens]HAT4183693.1 hypothetical protein [Clostridium perfringens]
MSIFKSKPTNYKTFVGGESFKQESKKELNINLNGISRSQRELNFLTSEVKALEELRSKYNKYEGKEYKLKVKELTKEIKEKNRRIQIVTRQEQGAKSKSKLELLKELLSFK